MCAAIFVVVVLLIVLSYHKGKSTGKQQQVHAMKRNALTLKVDYPLIEYYFDDDSEWLLVIRKRIFSKEEKFIIIDNSEVLEMNKEHLELITFPIGRGTTPSGIVYLYKNKKLIKEVPFTKYNVDNSYLNSQFTTKTLEWVQDKIGADLPAPV